jgi:hypothetical protein
MNTQKLSIYGFTQLHIDKCADTLCFCKNFKKLYCKREGRFYDQSTKPYLDKVYLKHLQKHIFVTGLKKRPMDIPLLCYYSIFSMNSLDLFTHAHSYFTRAKQLSKFNLLNSVMVNNVKDIMRRKMKKKFAHDKNGDEFVLRIDNVFYYEKKLKSLTEITIKTIEISMSFWNELYKHEPSMAKACKSGFEIKKNISILGKCFEETDEFINQNHYELYFHQLLFGIFYYFVVNRPETGQKLIKKAYEKINSLQVRIL